jgi:hypothetical protein
VVINYLIQLIIFLEIAEWREAGPPLQRRLLLYWYVGESSN